VTWLQFNAQLLRLTGEAHFAEQLERVTLNQLFGAERCDGTGWGYYVQMEGKKPYSSVLDGHCCLSSGPRGVALIPTFAVTTDEDGPVINLYEAGTANLKLRDGTPVTLVTKTLYPSNGKITITVNPETKKEFTVRLRMPQWCARPEVEINGKPLIKTSAMSIASYLYIRQEWKKGDRIQFEFKMEPRLLVGDHKNAGKVAVFYGPLVLAADESLLGNDALHLNAVGVTDATLPALNVKPESAPKALKTWPGAQVFRINAVTRKSTASLKAGTAEEIRLIPFADAGGTGTVYKVWLPYGQEPANKDLLIDGVESRSRKGNVGGSVIDGDVKTVAVTFSGKSAKEDWYAVAVDDTITIDRVVFFHGQTFHDGGWFDASQEKPFIQVKNTKDGEWVTVGKLDDYPATTASDSAGLKDGERFTCDLKSPMTVAAVRVVGKPASGDNPKQAFSSCAELEAFAGKP
jgi:hypothetical protein